MRDGFVADWRRRHGPEGERCAHRLFDASEQLLVELARWQFDDQLLHDGATFVARHARALLDRGDLPPGVTHPWLCEQIETLLGRTGVVVRHGDDLTFVHETLGEFFVATAVTPATVVLYGVLIGLLLARRSPLVDEVEGRVRAQSPEIVRADLGR